MKTLLNSWVIKYLTIFIMISTILFCAYKFVYYPPYEYINHEVLLKINKKNGDVYIFEEGKWILISK